MAVATPSLLFIPDATTLTNFGAVTLGSAYNREDEGNNAADPTNYTFHATGNPYDAAESYFEGKQNNGSNMSYFTSAATFGTTGQSTINFAVGFQLHTRDPNNSRHAFPIAAGGSNSGLFVRAQNISIGGDFDLAVWAQDTSFAIDFTNCNLLFTGLSYATNYQLACCLDTTTSATTVLRAKLGAAATQTTSSFNSTGASFVTNAPRFLRHEFTADYGFDGYLYYLAFGRGQTAWTSPDLADINSDPKAAIGGWPGGGPTFSSAWARNSNQVLVT